MSRGRGMTTKMHFSNQKMNFFTIFLQAFYRSEFDCDCVIYSLGCGKQENHNKKKFKKF